MFSVRPQSSLAVRLPRTVSPVADLGEGGGGRGPGRGRGPLFWVKKKLQKEEKPVGKQPFPRPPPRSSQTQNLNPPLFAVARHFSSQETSDNPCGEFHYRETRPQSTNSPDNYPRNLSNSSTKSSTSNTFFSPKSVLIDE